MTWEVIIPFLRPIEGLILNPHISDILVNGPEQIFIEKFGKLERVPGITSNEKSLQVALRNIARHLGNDINEERPVLDARLPDGSRITRRVPALFRGRHNPGHPEISKPSLRL